MREEPAWAYLSRVAKTRALAAGGVSKPAATMAKILKLGRPLGKVLRCIIVSSSVEHDDVTCGLNLALEVNSARISDWMRQGRILRF